MLRLTIMYRNAPDVRFDFDYYVASHMTLFDSRMKEFGFIGWQVQKCESMFNGDPPDFVCITHLDFADRARLMEGLAQHGAAFQADFAAYTNAQPEITVCSLVGSA